MPQVMPISIEILCHCNSEIKMYDEKQNVLVDIRQSSINNQAITPRSRIELTDALYCEILSLSDIDDISAFCARYRDISFFYKGQQLLGTDKEFLTEYAYYREIKRQLDLFRDYKSQYALYQRMDSLSDDEMLTLYSGYCRTSYYFPDNSTIWHFQSRFLFDSALHQCGFTDQTYGDITPVIKNRQVIGVSGNIPDQEKDNIYRKYQEIFLWGHKEDYLCLLTVMTKDNHAVFLPSKGIILYRCPTVLSAMYAKLVVSSFNADTYKMCAHPGCHNYFKVDKTHPQTRCPKHMKSRQTQRQNARIKVILGDENILRGKKEAQALEIQRAEARYERTKNIDEYISFWENIWTTDKGFLSKNNSQAFTLADLYIQQGRYQDALKFVKDIGKQEWFSEKAKEYIKKIKGLMAAESAADK